MKTITIKLKEEVTEAKLSLIKKELEDVFEELDVHNEIKIREAK